MDPARLPAELFAIVIDHATEGRNDVRTLCNFSLVSRQWHARLERRLYSRWLYDGEHHSISSLWKFLRSVLSSRRIADSVHEVNIRNWTFGLVHRRGRLALSQDDLDLARKAVRTAGLERIETRILEVLPKADPRPLMALLLANLRNLTTLYAQLPETDIFLSEVLRKAAEMPGDRSPDDLLPLHSLREAHLTSSWNYRSDGEPRDYYKLGLNHLWPVFRLPNIQRLSVFDLEAHGASTLLGDSTRTSSVTDLTLVYSSFSQVTVPDTLALLAAPKALTNLSIYLDDGHWASNRDQLPNADLWEGILQHADFIEHLDIYRDCSGDEDPHSSSFGSMRGFKRLKRLEIQPEVLLGDWFREDPPPSFHLKDTLPPNLESLTLSGDQGLILNLTLGPQLLDVIGDTGFPRLGQVALQETFPYQYEFDDPIGPPHEPVKEACRRHGIEYKTKPESSCTKGGKARRYYQHETEQRKRMSNKMVDVQCALTLHLSKLRGLPTHEDGDSSPVDRPKLSTEDLDTYELPWDELEEEYDAGLEYDVGDFHVQYVELDDSDLEAIRRSQENPQEPDGESEEYDGDSDGVW